MKRTRSTFTHNVEWSDQSPYSPSHTGALPIAAIVPDGTRVGIDNEDVQVALWRNNAPSEGWVWVKMGHDVSIKEKGWGDDGARQQGRSGAKVEILAPEGTTFLFAQQCDTCGDVLAEVGEDALFHGSIPEARCAKCAALIAEQEAWVE